MLPGNTTSDFNLTHAWLVYEFCSLFSVADPAEESGGPGPTWFLDRNEARRAGKKFFGGPPPPPSLFTGLGDRPASPTLFSWRSGSATDFSRNWLLRGTVIHSLVWFIFRWRIFMPICPLWNYHFLMNEHCRVTVINFWMVSKKVFFSDVVDFCNISTILQTSLWPITTRKSRHLQIYSVHDTHFPLCCDQGTMNRQVSRLVRVL